MTRALGVVAKSTLCLRAFSPSVEVLSVRGLAARTGLPRSTVHALATAMAADGLLEVVRGRGYRLGPLLVGLAGQIVERTGLVAAVEHAAPPFSADGQELHVGQLVGGWVVYLHGRAGSGTAPTDDRVGLRAPAWRGGCGKAALARLPEPEIEERVARVCREEALPLPDFCALHDDLAWARECGWLVSSSFRKGRTSVAAAVTRAGATPVGGLSVTGPSAQFTASAVARMGPEVAAAAVRASRHLTPAPDGSPG